MITTGSHVRSYDFENNRDCYVDGTVLAIKTKPDSSTWYEIQVERDVWQGHDVRGHSRIGELVYPPVNGRPKTFGGTCNGVEELS